MQYQTKKKLTRYIGIFLALLIVSYTAFEMKDVARGPELVIDYPTSGATVTTGLISVKGSVERISAIQINGNELFTDLSGHFTKDILLSEGYNVIEVRAEDRLGRTIEKKIELVAKNSSQGTPVALSRQSVTY